MSSEQVLGLFRAIVANNQDPLNETRVTLLIPQLLGNAESAWALPASPTNRVPAIGQVVWVQFSGGDITKPVYQPLGLLEIDASQVKVGGITADRIDATDLHVAAANVDGTLVAGQIDATNLHVAAANVTGTLTGNQLSANAIDGKTITGARVRTSAGFPRIELAPDGNQYFYTAAGQDPGRLIVDGSAGTLQITGPNGGGVDFGITLQKAFGSSSTTIDTDEVDIIGNANIGGLFSAGNVAWGSVTVNPVVNTDTSVTVTGVGLINAPTYRVFLTVNGGSPGALHPVTATNASADGFTLWINRSSTVNTNVWWLMLAK